MTYLAALKSFNNIVRKMATSIKRLKVLLSYSRALSPKKGHLTRFAHYILNVLFSIDCPNVYFLFVLQGDVKMHFKKSAMNWPQHFLYLL